MFPSTTRRDFIRQSSLVALGSSAPLFWERVSQAAPKSDQPQGRDTVLMVIQLSGGNDGLNTVIPFQDPLYAAARPTIAQSASKLLKINSSLGLHPNLTGLSKLLEQSQLAVVQGVGYPKPNRSHFVSMDIWHRASFSLDDPNGWLGKSLDGMPGTTSAIYVGTGETPLAVNAPSGRVTTLSRLEDYQLKVGSGAHEKQRRQAIEQFASDRSTSSSAAGGLLGQMRLSARESYRAAERLREIGSKNGSNVKYPSTGLGERLKVAAQLIAAGVPDRIFYTTLDGFDTHSAQLLSHGDLLRELGDAIQAFHQDLAERGHGKRVLTATFSEFGRRVKENGSIGTDHGAASQMFLAGEAVVAGPHGEHPSLSDLDDGDLKYHTDFRRVYATLLQHWLGVASDAIVGPEFASLPLLKTTA